MSLSVRVSEVCPRCGDDSDVWCFEEAEPTLTKQHYSCEMCGCEWTVLKKG